MVLFHGVNANAEMGWFICTVDVAGPNQSGIYICLTDTSYPQTFENKWFRARMIAQMKCLL